MEDINIFIEMLYYDLNLLLEEGMDIEIELPERLDGYSKFC